MELIKSLSWWQMIIGDAVLFSIVLGVPLLYVYLQKRKVAKTKTWKEEEFSPPKEDRPKKLKKKKVDDLYKKP